MFLSISKCRERYQTLGSRLWESFHVCICLCLNEDDWPGPPGTVWTERECLTCWTGWSRVGEQPSRLFLFEWIQVRLLQFIANTSVCWKIWRRSHDVTRGSVPHIRVLPSYRLQIAKIVEESMGSGHTPVSQVSLKLLLSHIFIPTLSPTWLKTPIKSFY